MRQTWKPISWTSWIASCRVATKRRRCAGLTFRRRMVPRAGKNVVRLVTAKNRYARALAAVTAWCRFNRHQPIPDQHAHLTAMMRGHYAYYGITGNSRRLSWYARQVARIWEKWLSRRDRGSRCYWRRFTALLKRCPLPAPRIVHRYTTANHNRASTWMVGFPSRGTDETTRFH